jgi:hypothetical protein
MLTLDGRFLFKCAESTFSKYGLGTTKIIKKIKNKKIFGRFIGIINRILYALSCKCFLPPIPSAVKRLIWKAISPQVSNYNKVII